MIISLIVAMDRRGVIGKDGALPWRLSDDLKRFKAITIEARTGCNDCRNCSSPWTHNRDAQRERVPEHGRQSGQPVDKAAALNLNKELY